MKTRDQKYPNRLHQVIKPSGYTVLDLAEETGIPKRTLFDYCAGRVSVPRERREVLAQALGYSSEYLFPPVSEGELVSISSDFSEEGVPPSTTKSEEIRAASHTLQSSENDIIATVQESGEVTQQSGPQVIDKLRRCLLQVGASTVGTFFSPTDKLTHTDIEVVDRLICALKTPSAIDIATLDQLEMLTKRAWQLLPETAGIVSINLFKYILERLQDTAALLAGSLLPSVRTRLCSIASEQAVIAGTMLYALRRYDEARRFYDVSVLSAKEAGNDPLQAVGLARMSFISTHNKQAHISLPFIQEARRLATQNGSTTTCTWLAAMEAEVQANMYMADPCLSALEQAELIHSSAVDDPYGTTFSPFLFAGYKSVCLLRLDQPLAAQQILRETLAQPDSPSMYQRSNMLTDLAAICVDQGEVKEGCNFASQAVMITNQTRSLSMLHYLLDFYNNHLKIWKDMPEVKDFYEKLHFVELSLMY